jgi:hypothetical protein
MSSWDKKYEWLLSYKLMKHDIKGIDRQVHNRDHKWERHEFFATIQSKYYSLIIRYEKYNFKNLVNFTKKYKSPEIAKE